MKAFVLLRQLEPYPTFDILEGLRAAKITPHLRAPNEEDDLSQAVVVTWNDYGRTAGIAHRVRKAGGLHLSVENGYTNAYRTEPAYAISKGAHHYVDREWQAMVRREVTLSWIPFKRYTVDRPGPILVLGQRGGAYSPLSMPNDWPDSILSAIRAECADPIIYKPHPGRPRRPVKEYANTKIAGATEAIDKYLKIAKRVIVWSSNGSTEALIAGVPVAYEGPRIPLSHLAAKGRHEPCKQITSEEIYAGVADLVKSEYTRAELRRGETWSRLCYRA